MNTQENSPRNLLDILNNVQLSLQNFTSNVAGGGNDWLLSPFGNSYDEAILFSILSAWNNADFSNLPEIQVISSDILGNANGGYSQQTNKIYLADNFLNNAQPYTIEGVILEEIGHWIDAQINIVDSAGDEGAIFSALVQGKTLTEDTLTQLKAEDDSATITIDGEERAIEMSNTAYLPFREGTKVYVTQGYENPNHSVQYTGLYGSLAVDFVVKTGSIDIVSVTD